MTPRRRAMLWRWACVGAGLGAYSVVVLMALRCAGPLR